jgi:hypothetical protein
MSLMVNALLPYRQKEDQMVDGVIPMMTNGLIGHLRKKIFSFHASNQRPSIPSGAKFKREKQHNMTNATENQNLTRREYIAAMMPGNLDGYSVSTLEEVFGIKLKSPQTAKEAIDFWLEIEARYKVMQADALIKALNSNPL